MIMGAQLSFKSLSMPLGMVVGALLCRPITWLDGVAGGMLTPVFIFTMLFFTFCRVDARKIRFSMMHLWLILLQLIASFLIYYALVWADIVVAQGAMICVLAPVAMAAVVIGAMLGANVETMAAYSLLCNLVVALVAPYMLHAYGNGECTMAQILQKVSPLLIAPFFAGQLCRFGLPKVAQWVGNHSQISFYVWLLSLAVIVAKTTTFLLDTDANLWIEITLAIISLLICLLQFKVGRMIGRRYGDAAAGGQSLGQKNTVLAVWMSQSFLDPIASVAPTAYIVWQNIVNSYQIYRMESRKVRKS